MNRDETKTFTIFHRYEMGTSELCQTTDPIITGSVVKLRRV